MANRQEEETFVGRNVTTDRAEDEVLRGRTRDEELRVPVVEEELAVDKETLGHTVRRSDVTIEPLIGGRIVRRGFDSVDAACRTHFHQNFASNGWEYDSGYSHAYRYGYDLAGSGRDWSTLEGDVRMKWESRNKGTWARFKDAIRYGYDRGR
jgi:hypothetical protein